MKLKLVNFNLELRVGDKQNEGIIAIIAFITNILREKNPFEHQTSSNAR